MKNGPENTIFTKNLQNFLREGYNNNDPETGRQWLETLRQDYEDEVAFLTPGVETQIDEEAFGPRIKAVYLRFLEFSEQPMTPEQKEFLQKNRHLLY